MMSSISKTSMAYCITDRQFRSLWTTTLATLRWTNTSPGSTSMIWLAGTRLSEQPIHKYLGACSAANRWKNVGSLAVIRSAQARLLSIRCFRVRIGFDSVQYRQIGKAGRQPLDAMLLVGEADRYFFVTGFY